MGQDPGAIRQDIEQTRERMGDTVEALGYKTDVTGRAKEVLPHLAKHMEVQALDLHGVDAKLAREAEDQAADTVKRFRTRDLDEAAWFDHEACTSPRWIERFIEMKTIWHPSGA